LDAQITVESGDWKKILLWIMERGEQFIVYVAVGEHKKG